MAPVVLAFLGDKTVNKLNPFSGPRSLQAERQLKRREQFKVVVWAVVGANVVLFMGMLIQGCRGEPTSTETEGNKGAEVAASDTNSAAMARQASQGDAPVPPTFEPAAPTTAQPLTNNAPPAVTDAVPNPAPSPTRQYAVLKGDSLYKIARANKVSQKALAEANPGSDLKVLKVGQVLQLPVGTDSGTTVTTSTPPASHAVAGAHPSGKSKSHSRYVVKSGDSLSRIARTHGTTVKAIKAANGLTSDHIVAGQSLKLPGSGAAATASAPG
jgi:N-acetylmuramoyl-L-alanine amidase